MSILAHVCYNLAALKYADEYDREFTETLREIKDKVREANVRIAWNDDWERKSKKIFFDDLKKKITQINYPTLCPAVDLTDRLVYTYTSLTPVHNHE